MTVEPTPLHLPILQALDELEAMLPELREQHEAFMRMEVFAALADPILDHARVLDGFQGGSHCREMAVARIEAMLEAAGWVDANGMVLD